MANKQLQLRRGTATQNSAFTGAEGEIIYVTDTKTVALHDGSIQGGQTLLKSDMSNLAVSGGTLNFTNYNITASDPEVGSHVATKTFVENQLSSGGVANLSNIGDVTAATLSANNLLAYNGTNWVNVATTGDIGFTVSENTLTATIPNGTVENDQIANGTIANAKLVNSKLVLSDGQGTSENAALGSTVTIQGTTNEVAVSLSGSTFTASLPDDVTIGGTLSVDGNAVISGNLTVSGTTTTVNTEQILLADNIITLNSNETGAPSENAGIEVQRGTSTNAYLRWQETDDRWEIYDGTTPRSIVSIEESPGSSNQIDASGQIVDGSIDAAALGTDAVTTNKIDDLAVTEIKLANDAVTFAKLAAFDDSLTLTAGYVLSAQTANTINALQIGGDVSAAVNGSALNLTLGGKVVDTPEIADGAVDTLQLAVDAVDNSKLANNAVQAANIVDGNVTTLKLAANAVTADKIADNTITYAQLAAFDDNLTLSAGRVLSAQTANTINALDVGGDLTASVSAGGGTLSYTIKDNAVNADKILNGAVNENKLGTDAVITAKIKNGAVTNAKLQNSVIKVTDTVNEADIALGNTLTFAETANETTVSQSGGTVTIGLASNVTATTFTGALVSTSISNSDSISITATDAAKAVIVDGVSFQNGAVTGVTSLSASGTITASTFSGTSTLAAEATTLVTARSIGGASFDGSQDITPLQISIADEENENADRLVMFADGNGTQQPKNAGDFTYNPSTGQVSAAKVAVGASGLVIDSTAVTSSAAELNYLDGVTLGTAIAGKALTAAATTGNIDLGSGNISAEGTVTFNDQVTCNDNLTVAGALTGPENQSLILRGGVKYDVNPITSNETLAVGTDHVVDVRSSATVTLPTINAGRSGASFIILNSSGGNITLNTATSNAQAIYSAGSNLVDTSDHTIADKTSISVVAVWTGTAGYWFVI